ncbi:hypothetical protein P7C70_g7715, partial [Phenoliferia sp. Uapishka_3]
MLLICSFAATDDSDRDGSNSPQASSFASTSYSTIESLDIKAQTETDFPPDSCFSGIPSLDIDSTLPAYFPLPLPPAIPAGLPSPGTFLAPQFDFASYVSTPFASPSPYPYYNNTAAPFSLPPITTPPPHSPEEEIFYDGPATEGAPLYPLEALFQKGATSEWNFDGIYENGWAANSFEPAVFGGVGAEYQYGQDPFWSMP